MTDNRKLVSAIITTHNRASDVVKAIESVKKQSYKNIQIIVVDDASNDETHSVLEKMEGIKYIRINDNESKGGNHARNVGIKASYGDYVAFLDDDDEWLPNKIEKQINLINLDDSIGMVYCELMMDTGIRLLNYNVAFDAEGDILQQKRYYKPICTTSAMLVRRDIILEIGCFDEKVKYWQEYELTLRLIQHCKIGLVKEPLVKYCINIKSKKKLTNNYDGWQESVAYIWNKHKKIFDILDDKGKERQMETYYSEAAIRSSRVGLIKESCNYYAKAYKLTGKIEYYIRWKTGISRTQTILLELIIKKCIYFAKRIMMK